MVQKYIVDPPSKEEVQRILDFLSLDFNTFNSLQYIDYSIDKLMRKKERINLSPFIKINDNYLFGNQQAILSAKAWFHPLKDGDAPFTLENGIVKSELASIRTKLDKKLEEEAYSLAQDTLRKKFTEKNIQNFKRLNKNFIKRPSCGEIDLLIVNPHTYTVFVLDAKNINKKLFTSAIATELRDFFHGRGRQKSYLGKLNMKVDFVTNNLDKILEYFKLENNGEWYIKKGFVVNTLYFSAFYEEKVDFILLDDLKEYLIKI